MAILKTDNKEITLTDGAAVIDAAEELGVPFGCRQGICGACRTEVVEGMENLSELDEEEKEMSLESNERLMCQCKIKKGTVKIKV